MFLADPTALVSDGLTFEFLFNIAKELDENDEMMLIGGGQKGKETFDFQNNVI